MTPPTQVQDELPPLPPGPDTVSLAHSGYSGDYIDGYEQGFDNCRDQMQAYARTALAACRAADEALMRELLDEIEGDMLTKSTIAALHARLQGDSRDAK